MSVAGWLTVLTLSGRATSSGVWNVFLHLPHDGGQKVGCEQNIEIFGGNDTRCLHDDRQRLRRCRYGVEPIGERRHARAGNATPSKHAAGTAFGHARKRQLSRGGDRLKQLSNHYIAERWDRQCHNF
jgi:hypothetical protein